MTRRKVERLLTRTQLAQYLQLHAETVMRKVKSGEIPAYSSGTRTLRFDLDEVLDSMRRVSRKHRPGKQKRGKSTGKKRVPPARETT